RHPLLVRGQHAANELAVVGFAGHKGLGLQRRVALVEPEAALLCGRTVALEAVIRQDRPYVALKINRRLRGQPRTTQANGHNHVQKGWKGGRGRGGGAGGRGENRGGGKPERLQKKQGARGMKGAYPRPGLQQILPKTPPPFRSALTSFEKTYPPLT